MKKWKNIQVGRDKYSKVSQDTIKVELKMSAPFSANTHIVRFYLPHSKIKNSILFSW